MSIRKVTKADGSKAWRGRDRDPDGKSRAKWFERKVDAERHIASMTVSVMQGSYFDPTSARCASTAMPENGPIGSRGGRTRATPRCQCSSIT